MTARTLIVGDVHGCAEELEKLVAQVGLRRDDALIMVGDLVGKGPESREVLRFLRRWRARSVVGNHDFALLRCRSKTGKDAAPDSIRKLAKKLDAEDWAYLEAMPLTLELPEHGALVAHGGLVPGVALADQEPDTVMNMRSLRADGTPTKRIEEGTPWGASWPGALHVYFGHDAVRGLQRHPFATGLDTGCVYGGRLTGILLPDRELVSVKAKRVYSEPGRSVAKRLR